jgi:hypothetical protein
MTNIPKIVVNNKKSETQKKLDNYGIRCELYGQRNALINQQTDLWIKIEEVNKKILVLEPKKKKNKGSNVY